MRLEDLLIFHDIVIQCHNNPDADAIASGFGVYRYLKSKGIAPRLIYGGDTAIQKSNLVLMTEILEIPIEHVRNLPEAELLLCVDCQYGGGNVARFPAKMAAVIDHHKQEVEFPVLREVRDRYGSCSTIVWDMLREAGYAVEADERLATALYYGLFMDTGKMQELGHPKDRDLRDELEFCCDKSLLLRLQNCNLSGEELRIAGRALSRCEYMPEYRFALAEAESCDPNILGIISDMLLEADIVDTCVAFCILEYCAKLSVRSCTSETKANELARYLTEGVGSGGGHAQKAGGSMGLAELKRICGSSIPDGAVQALVRRRAAAYFENQSIMHSETSQVPDLTGEPLYQMRRQPIGYIKGTDFYPEGTEVCIRTLEGDFTFDVKADTYFLFGANSEVYRVDEEDFLARYDLIGRPYVFRGEYAPSVHQKIAATSGLEAKPLASRVRTCIPKADALIHGREIKAGRVKVFRSWDKDNYMLGLPGDWLAVRAENPTDCFIVDRENFFQNYVPCVRTLP